VINIFAFCGSTVAKILFVLSFFVLEAKILLWRRISHSY